MFAFREVIDQHVRGQDIFALRYAPGVHMMNAVHSMNSFDCFPDLVQVEVLWYVVE